MKPLSTLSAPEPGNGEEGLALATFLPYRLNVLATVISEGLARLYGERFDLDIPGWRVLATVGEYGSITGTAVGQHARMSKVKVSRAVAALAARGWIERRPNADDLREAFLTLTAEGRRAYRDIVPLARGYEAALLRDLGEGERRALSALIDRLLAAASRDPAADPLRAGRP
ncbi:MarR family winged helix-turn-helix transcriptional regulator [Methylobacterium sp. JK268]